jgi:hypothetical protein
MLPALRLSPFRHSDDKSAAGVTRAGALGMRVVPGASRLVMLLTYSIVVGTVCVALEGPRAKPQKPCRVRFRSSG